MMKIVCIEFDHSHIGWGSIIYNLLLVLGGLNDSNLKERDGERNQGNGWVFFCERICLGRERSTTSLLMVLGSDAI